MESKQIVSRDPEVMNGALVFTGTRGVATFCSTAKPLYVRRMSATGSSLRGVDPPSQRIHRLTFNPKVEYTDDVIHLGNYRCPHCDAGTEFNT